MIERPPGEHSPEAFSHGMLGLDLEVKVAVGTWRLYSAASRLRSVSATHRGGASSSGVEARGSRRVI